jgi:hypothetical protein
MQWLTGLAMGLAIAPHGLLDIDYEPRLQHYRPKADISQHFGLQ